MGITKTVDNTKEGLGEKPRDSHRGSRSVSRLSAEQRARKRASDREAQRANRQKQKDYIASLERRVSELSVNRRSDVSIEEARQRTAELEEELKLLRQNLFQSRNGTNSPELVLPNFGHGEFEPLCSASYPRAMTSRQVVVDAAEPFHVAAAQNLSSPLDMDCIAWSHEHSFWRSVAGNSIHDYFASDSSPTNAPVGAGQHFPASQGYMGSSDGSPPDPVVYNVPFHDHRLENNWSPFYG